MPGDGNIAKAACDYFQQVFTGEDKVINENPIKCITRLVNDEHNKNLTKRGGILHEPFFSRWPYWHEWFIHQEMLEYH